MTPRRVRSRRSRASARRRVVIPPGYESVAALGKSEWGDSWFARHRGGERRYALTRLPAGRAALAVLPLALALTGLEHETLARASFAGHVGGGGACAC